MSKTLELHFLTPNGKTARVSVNDPKEGLTAAEIQTAMDQIILSQVFLTENGPLASVKEARYVSRDVQVVEVTVEA